MLYGLSPRGRGNHMRYGAPILFDRSIPAWAGEPWAANPNIRPERVYPRVGGGTWQTFPPTTTHIGLSPRGRGNPSPISISSSLYRSIPAWAGEPKSPSDTTIVEKVYPRVGGGTGLCPPVQVGNIGLSPRGRGNRQLLPHAGVDAGSIPAWAGEPQMRRRWPSSWAVYPRVGGGTLRRNRVGRNHRGLSPRGRGNPQPRRTCHPFAGSIPAWAGEPSRRWRCGRPYRVYPRVGGGTSSSVDDPGFEDGLSPRGRGNLLMMRTGSS